MKVYQGNQVCDKPRFGVVGESVCFDRRTVLRMNLFRRKNPTAPMTELEAKRIEGILAPDGLTAPELLALPLVEQLMLLGETKGSDIADVESLPTRNVIGQFTQRIREEADAQQADYERYRENYLREWRKKNRSQADNRFGKGKGWR